MSVQQQQRANTKSIGNYILGRTIGEGTFGKVKLGRHILSGANVAVKVLQKERIVEVADVERVAREVHILKLIRHPHIVQLFEIIETRGQLYLIMEYASGGELFDYIVAKGRVPEQEACRFFHQLIAGVEKIHEMHVVHRDLKPENLLLDEHNCVKIVDFGLSNLFRDGQRLSTACGSPCYAPPEMVAGQQYVPQMCDLWSCGVILFALVCGYLPFEDQNTAALYKKILAADYALPNFISDAVKDLISGLLTVDPQRRFKISDVRAHAWYRQVPEASVQPVERSAGSASLDEDVLHELEAYGFPRDYAVRCLELNKHNHITTTYWLLLERKRRVLEQLDMTGASGVDGSHRATASSAGAAGGPRPSDAEVTPTHRAGAGDGAMTPIVGGTYTSEQQSAGGRTPRAGTVGPTASARESSHTPRCDTGRNSQQSRRVSATVPRPNTSPNRRGDNSSYSARGRGGTVGAGGHEGVGSISVAAAAAATPRTNSPWRSNDPRHQAATPHAYSARGRTSGGSGNNVAGPEGGDRSVISGAVTPGLASPYRPGAIAGHQQSATPNPYSARGSKGGNGSSGGNVGALDSNGTTSTAASTTPGASSPWRGQASGATQIGSARGKGGSGNNVTYDGGGGNAAANGVASGASSPWRASGGAGQQSTTPQATPRVCTTPRAAFTPRGQAVTPRAATPQGTSTVYRHPAHSQPPQSSQSAQPQSSTLPAGMAGRPVMSSRRRPPTATSVGVVPGTAPVRTVGTPTSRMIWR